MAVLDHDADGQVTISNLVVSPWFGKDADYAATCAASAQFDERTSRAKRAEPVTLVRSPIIWKLESGRMVRGSRPANWVKLVKLSTTEDTEDTEAQT